MEANELGVERTQVLKTIKVKLTVGEVADRAKSASSHQVEADALTEEFEAHKKRLKPQIDEANKELRRLLTVIESGFEERTEDVEMVKDYNIGTVKYFFGGQVVEEHSLKEDDRQQVLKMPESQVGAQSQEEEIQEVIAEQTNLKTATGMVM